ncbi:MAG: hypothetical protein JWO36_3732 [Myxococcales bacterium]|nr:hypothetical protein [Myxococcales bacterium]
MWVPEQCDDGPLNGTPQDPNRCTKQCLRGDHANGLEPIQHVPFAVAFPMKKIVELEINTTCPSLAFTGFDDTGAHVALGPPNAGGFSLVVQPQIVTMKVHSAPSGLGRLWRPNGDFSSPLWVERAVPGVGGPWLFFATFSADFTPTIHELPYPFPDGEGGEIIVEDGQMPLLVDQSTTTHELLVAAIVSRSDTDIAIFPARFPAAGNRRGVIVGSPGWATVQLDGTPSLLYVQFFDDTLGFQTIAVQLPTPGDVFATTGDYRMFEHARGSWPFRVAAASFWNKRAFLSFEGRAHGPYPPESHPTAVMSDTGDIYTWQFDASPGETLTRYAHVAPGSIMTLPVDSNMGSDPLALWVLQPDGTQIALIDGDSDPSSVQSQALMPLAAPGTAPWQVATTALPLTSQFSDVFAAPPFVTDSNINWFLEW